MSDVRYVIDPPQSFYLSPSPFLLALRYLFVGLFIVLTLSVPILLVLMLTGPLAAHELSRTYPQARRHIMLTASGVSSARAKLTIWSLQRLLRVSTA